MVIDGKHILFSFCCLLFFTGRGCLFDFCSLITLTIFLKVRTNQKFDTMEIMAQIVKYQRMLND